MNLKTETQKELEEWYSENPQCTHAEWVAKSEELANRDAEEKPADDTPKPKKSDLLKEQVTLENQYAEGVKTNLNSVYTVKIGSKKNFNSLMRYIEHDAEFDHTTAAYIVMLYSNLKQQKPFLREPDWNGTIQLIENSCVTLWRLLSSYKGRGVHEGESFLELVQDLGQDLSKTVKTIREKNESVRGLHTRLNQIYNIIDSGDCENDLTEEEEKEILAKSDSIIKTEHRIAEEVNPEI